MKKILLSVALMIASISLHATDANYQVVPLPQSITAEKGAPFVLEVFTSINVASKDDAMRRNGEFLKQYITEATGITLDDQNKKGNTITLKLNPKIENEEGYVITIKANTITIEGKTPRGVFYGVQTLRKSLPLEKAKSVTFPAARIVDYPRFAYRGTMLDCARHYFKMSFIKEFIDMLALHNVNTFHWHLTEDQGWRAQIDRYPKLTEVGSKRAQTVIGRMTDLYDETPYGGYYTKDEMREVVKYAADRYITVIPEIDMPGHMLAALAAYPELGCTGGPYKVAETWGVFPDILCAGHPETYEFVNNVLDEIIEIFPSKYIHIGGDEAPRARWKTCPRCQAEIKRLGLKGSNGFPAEAQLQAHFMNQAAKHLAEKGRNIIGWDEILEGDVDKGTTVMSWRGVNGGIEAAKRGLDAIMTPVNYYYLDYYQRKDNTMTLIGGFLPVETTYGYNPVPDDAAPELKKHVKGVQANLWTEYVIGRDLAFFQLLPRVAAMAETGWTENDKKDFASFKERETRLNELYKHFGWKTCQDLYKEKK